MKDYYLVAMILNTNQGIKAFWNQVRVQIKQKTIAESAQVICSKRRFEEAPTHSQWGETTQVHMVQLFMRHSLLPQNSYQEAHRGKTAPVQST